MPISYIVARQLGGKLVVSTGGEDLGRVDDIEINEKTGQFISLIVEPNQKILSRVAFPRDSNGNLIIPYDAVQAISKVVIVKD